MEVSVARSPCTCCSAGSFQRAHQMALSATGYAIGAQIGIALTPRIATVATVLATQTKFRAIGVVEVTLVQYDVGVESARGAPRESTHRVIPFVGLGAGGRTYDFRDAGTASRTYPAWLPRSGARVASNGSHCEGKPAATLPARNLTREPP
jgi:hypothetical protein